MITYAAASDEVRDELCKPGRHDLRRLETVTKGPRLEPHRDHTR